MPELEVRHGGTDISAYILDYKRELDICTGIGTVTIQVAKTYSGSFEVWDSVTVYEDGTKRGEFNVGKITKDSESLSSTVFCQDNSKKLADYFVAESYYINYYSTTRQWIEKFMADAGVTCTFTTTSVGPPLSKDTTLGIDTAYEIIVVLLQQSGWYMYFNDSGNAVVGKLSLDLSNYKKVLNNDDILEISKVKDDKMLRNRAVVWGNANIETGEWVFADLRRNTTWNYDVNDLRTVLFSNHQIPNNTVALDLANQIIEEFCRITEVKSVKLHGFHNVHIGDVVMIKSNYHNGMGLVTSIEVTGNDNGFLTTLTLDERCPRLFSYYGFDQGKVYCGTHGSGVWEKDLDGSIWSDFSTGILDLSIKDLSIANGVFACVTDSGQAYVRDISDSYWTLLSYGDFVDEVDHTVTSGLTVTAKACAVNRATSEVYILFQGGGKSWVGLVVNKILVGTQQVYINLNGTKYTSIYSVDVDTDDLRVYVTAGLSGIPSSIFYTYQFPVIEAFTYNDEEEFREFGANYGGEPSNAVYDYGRVHYINSPINYTTRVTESNSFYAYTHDFSGASVVDITSTKQTPTVTGYFVGSHAFLSSDRSALYICTDEYYTPKVYKYDFLTDTTDYIKATSPGDIYDNIIINVTTSHKNIGGTDFYVYTLEWEDIETGETGEEDFASIEQRDTEYSNFQGSWNHFGNVGLLYSHVCKNNNSSSDNNVDGCCSYDDTYFAYSYLLGIIFNTSSKSFTTFMKIIHPNTELEASDEFCTSHTNLTENAKYREVVGIWTTINYNSGVPWIYGQYTIVDYGPWVSTGGTPPYQLLGYRENFEESPPLYPRAFKYNLVTDTLYLIDDADIPEQIYEGGGYDSFHRYSKDITLANSADSEYWDKYYTTGIEIVYDFWQTTDLTPSENTYLIENLWRFGAQNLTKMDYYFDEYVGVFGIEPKKNISDVQIGWNYYIQTMPFIYDMSRPTISGYTHRLLARSYNVARPNLFYPSLYQTSSQNVLGVKCHEQYWSDSFGSFATHFGWRFYQFGDWQDFLISAYFTTVNTVSGFQIIDLTTLPHYLEVGSSGPIVTYAKGISGYVDRAGIPSGKIRVGLYPPSGLQLPSGYNLGAPISGNLPDYSFVTPNGDYTVIMDARTFNMSPSVSLPLQSGYLTPSGVTVIGIAMDKSIYAKRTDQLTTSGWDIVVTMDEYTTNYETTNFFSSPYMFTATISSYVPSGMVITLSGLSKFYQVNPYSNYWINYTPVISSYITCIRVDDRL